MLVANQTTVESGRVKKFVQHFLRFGLLGFERPVALAGLLHPVWVPVK